MQIEYKNKKLKNLCTNIKVAKKELPNVEAEKLLKAIGLIEAAYSLHDVISYSPFHFHNLKGDRKGEYAIDINGRRSSYRLIIKPIDEDVPDIFASAKSIEIIMVWEVSKHYE
ncbi:MAG: hypothetical protein GXZ13_07885 [Synergistaceae bacterium]|nr:hypothetical protein [Synergistaceae bacterium]